MATAAAGAAHTVSKGPHDSEQLADIQLLSQPLLPMPCAF